ncbi:TatD family deoxyribonuclease [Paenibacillus nanensis]|uniref:TatD family deoxyribonuclease n=1 Tax=Paenibacillus nanensis TaxID=393251 RepID=A0A3A1UNJ7_9BACL|nr:TatD family hydrolase [Paenibacillus nanensis]RIX49904.1 TatD family deoxyribonuclease [Paenibacillus nanensis]
MVKGTKAIWEANQLDEPASYVDAHIHLDKYTVEERDRLLEEAFREGVATVVAVSMDLASSKINAELARRYPGSVHPAYGFHPEQEPPSAQERERLLTWIRERHTAGEAFAIGEVGLPYYMRTEREAAGKTFDETAHLELLESFVRLAAELDCPIVLHAVYEDADKAYELLRRYNVSSAHFHWFKGSMQTVERLIEAGYFISLTPDVVYEPEIIALAKRYPLELMMTETDGPWPHEGPFAGQSTKPPMVKRVAAEIARLKGLPLAEAETALLRNAKRFYRI